MILTADNFKDKVAVVTGGSGALGGAMAKGLAGVGMKVAILGRTQHTVQAKIDEIKNDDATIIGVVADVLDKQSLLEAKQQILDTWGRIDILVNAAGGNVKGAVVMPEDDFFEADIEAFDSVMALNFKGTVLPVLIFGKEMAHQKTGSIINISSMAAQRPLTRVVGYAASKAAIDNFTRWLAVEMATKYSENIRVNAIAPGFFIGEQNRNLLLKEDGSLTQRGKIIIEHTPLKRFGEADELISTLLWLCSDASGFITGIVVPVDGGFSAFSGI